MNIRMYIDYDNLEAPFKVSGLLDVVTRSILATRIPTTATTGRCDVRVYGGWYENTTLTPLAQNMTAELGRDFPAVLPFLNKQAIQGRLSVSAELALSLEAEPGHHLFNTFRVKSLPRALKCEHPQKRGCKEPDCPLIFLPHLFNTGRCPKNGCSLQLTDVIFRREQKLVDTMLTCDMIHAARMQCDYVILVSSDDDMLPAIRVVLLDGTPLARLHPKNYYKLSAFPTSGATLTEKKL